MKKPPKLTDEELSRVLSQHAIDKLDHGMWDSADGCGCVGGAAYFLGDGTWCLSEKQLDRLLDISIAVDPASNVGHFPYPTSYPASTPEELLQYLHDRGVA